MYCVFCDREFPKEQLHKQDSYLLKTGERIYRYSCRPCKALRMDKMRNKPVKIAYEVVVEEEEPRNPFFT